MKKKQTTWLWWNGGKCPVKKLARFDIRFANGIVSENVTGSYWEWRHTQGEYNIVAYRVL